VGNHIIPAVKEGKNIKISVAMYLSSLFSPDTARHRLAIGYQPCGTKDGCIFKSQAVQENG
jgi:hypothetical protein